jgi:predicted Ser/Thr protein kinase
MSDLRGVINKRYYIIETIGHGGMTTVYKALDVKREKEVAVKVLAPYLVVDPIFKARFEREIKILTEFEHPNIVPIIDYGEHEGSPYLVMPFFPEGTLADRVRSSPMSSQEIGTVINDIAYGLDYEHKRGIVHRDIKPSNILLDKDGRAYLSDFDLVYIQDASKNLTGSAVIGTPAYMSPEQCSSGPIDIRSDQYSLAIVLFQLVTGHLPFYADTPIAIALQQINEPIPSPRDFNPNIPQPIENVLLKALSKDPDKRYPSILAFNQAFQKALRISIISHEANGSWTAKYYEITQVLGRIQSRAKGWFFQSVLKKRYSLPGILLLLLILSTAVYAMLASTKGSSDSALKATIAAIYTNVAQQENSPAEGVFLETIVAGTLESLALSGSPIPVTGGEASDATELSYHITFADLETAEANDLLESLLTSTVTPDILGTQTNTPLPMSSQATEKPLPGKLTSTPSLTPTVTSTISPTPTIVGSPTGLSTPSKTPSRTPTVTSTTSPTPTPTPTSATPTSENSCANVRLTDFNVKAVEVSYNLANSKSDVITIQEIHLDWPIGNQSLKEVQVGGNRVWSIGDDEPPTLVSGLGIDLAAGASTQIKFTFKRAAAANGYFIMVTLANGCVIVQ